MESILGLVAKWWSYIPFLGRVTKVVLEATSRAQDQWGQQNQLLSVPGRHSRDFFQDQFMA